VCYNTYRTAAQLARALWTMVIMGTLISIFGIAQRVTWNGRLYWIGPLPGEFHPLRPLRPPAHFAVLMVTIVHGRPRLRPRRHAGRAPEPRARRWADRLMEWSTERGATRLIPSSSRDGRSGARGAPAVAWWRSPGALLS